jgi:hypothetical protein
MPLTVAQREWLRAMRERLARDAMPVPYDNHPRCPDCCLVTTS